MLLFITCTKYFYHAHYTTAIFSTILCIFVHTVLTAVSKYEVWHTIIKPHLQVTTTHDQDEFRFNRCLRSGLDNSSVITPSSVKKMHEHVAGTGGCFQIIALHIYPHLPHYHHTHIHPKALHHFSFSTNW